MLYYFVLVNRYLGTIQVKFVLKKKKKKERKENSAIAIYGMSNVA